MTSENSLFQPFKLGSLTLDNRIVMAPMTRNFSPNDNVPGDNVVDYYRRRAEGGVGLIITEGTCVGQLGQAVILEFLIFTVKKDSPVGEEW